MLSTTTLPKGIRWADALLQRHRQPYLPHPRSGRLRYADYSGCGNTLNANNPIVRRMIIDSPRYCNTEMTSMASADLASTLSRDSKGHVLPNRCSPLVESDRFWLAPG